MLTEARKLKLPWSVLPQTLDPIVLQKKNWQPVTSLRKQKLLKMAFKSLASPYNPAIKMHHLLY